MPRYAALMTGAGDGCGFTIDCNKTFMIFDAANNEMAIGVCWEKWHARGGSSGEPRIEKIVLVVIESVITVPVNEWNERGEADEEREDDEAELAEAEKKVKQLRSKLGKE